MARTRKLEAKAREMIYQKICDSGELDAEELFDLINPHFLFDEQSARRRDVLRLGNQMVAKIKDDKGIRTVFACKVDGVRKYVDIELSQNIKALRSVEGQLTEKCNGLEISCAKASLRRMEVEGQLSMDLSATGAD